MAQEIRLKKKHSLINIIFLCITLLLFTVGIIFLEPTKRPPTKEELSLYIAKVNGVGLSREAFENEVSIAEQNSLSFGGDTALKIKIRKDVLMNHIISYLWVELANSLNVKISDTHLNNMIQKQSVFHENGVFNQKKYIQLLEANGYSPELYVETLRVSIEKEQLTNALIMSEFMLPIDSELSFLKNQVRTGYYGKIYPDIVDHDAIDVPEQDVLSFYNKYLDSFIRPDRVKVKYIQNSYSKAVNDIPPITEKDIQREYTQNAKKYSSIKKEQYELIITKTKEESDRIYKQLIRNKLDKQALIDNNQIIPLGWFSEDSLPELLKKQKLSKKHFVSKPLFLDGSYIIVVLTDVQKPQIFPLEKLSNKIQYTLQEERALALYKKRNQQLKEAINNKKFTMADIATQTENELIILDNWQSPLEYDSLLLDSKIENVALSELMVKNNTATNNISDLIEADNSLSTYIIQVTDYRAKGLAPLEEVKNKIIDEIKRKKAITLFKDEAKNIVDKLNSNQPVNFMPTTKYIIDRNSVGFKESTIEMIFSLKRPIDSKDRTHGLDFLSEESAIIAVLTNIENSTEIEDISTELLPIMLENENQAFNTLLINKANIEFMTNLN